MVAKNFGLWGGFDPSHADPMQLQQKMLHFTHATMHSAVFATATCLSVRLSQPVVPIVSSRAKAGS